jgi:uncharacterized protein YndB with AHSA1/START domain
VVALTSFHIHLYKLLMIDSTRNDVRAQVAAISRRLGMETSDGPDTAVLTASRSYAAPPEEVWDAITNPERIPRWFLPVEGELRLGGRYQLQGNAGGTIQRCEPPRQLAVTWEFGGQASLVEVRLTGADADTRTTLELVHSAPVDPHWGQFGPGAVGIGWDMTLFGLDLHLQGDTSITPETAAQWMASDEGRAFMTSSGEQWQMADIAAGTPPEDAAAAAARCLAAYTGTEADPAGAE